MPKWVFGFVRRANAMRQTRSGRYACNRRERLRRSARRPTKKNNTHRWVPMYAMTKAGGTTAPRGLPSTHAGLGQATSLQVVLYHEGLVRSKSYAAQLSRMAEKMLNTYIRYVPDQRAALPWCASYLLTQSSALLSHECLRAHRACRATNAPGLDSVPENFTWQRSA